MTVENKAAKRLTQAWAGGLIVSLVLLVIPFGGLILYPFTLLNTFIHEGMHAFAGLATGGAIGTIVINPDGSGVTQISGGFTLVTASAGYVGSSLFGGLLILLARSEKMARRTIWITCGFLALVLLLWVRGGLVGLLFGVAWTMTLAYVATRVQGANVFWIAQFLGIQQVLGAFSSIRDLFIITRTDQTPTDARLLENAVGIPAGFWVHLWTVSSAVILGWCIRTAWRQANSTSNNPQV